MVKVISDTEPPVRFGAWQDEISSLIAGALVGFLTWILTYLFSNYVVGVIACQTGSSLIACHDAASVSAAFALVFASLAGLTLLVRRRVFRPLLVVIAAAATLWGINGNWLHEQSFVSFLLTIILAAIVYLVFGWFSKISQFWVAVVVTVGLVVVFRLLMSL